jgi:hypothetical protein
LTAAAGPESCARCASARLADLDAPGVACPSPPGTAPGPPQGGQRDRAAARRDRREPGTEADCSLTLSGNRLELRALDGAFSRAVPLDQQAAHVERLAAGPPADRSLRCVRGGAEEVGGPTASDRGG